MSKSRNRDPVGAIEGTPRSRTAPAGETGATRSPAERADGDRRFSDFDEAGYERRDWLDAERARKAREAGGESAGGESAGGEPAGGGPASPGPGEAAGRGAVAAGSPDGRRLGGSVLGHADDPDWIAAPSGGDPRGTPESGSAAEPPDPAEAAGGANPASRKR
ncbi:MAG: hypothetical protein AB7P21_25855 [Lautropia sp.]